MNKTVFIRLDKADVADNCATCIDNGIYKDAEWVSLDLANGKQGDSFCMPHMIHKGGILKSVHPDAWSVVSGYVIEGTF